MFSSFVLKMDKYIFELSCFTFFHCLLHPNGPALRQNTGGQVPPKDESRRTKIPDSIDLAQLNRDRIEDPAASGLNIFTPKPVLKCFCSGCFCSGL